MLIWKKILQIKNKVVTDKGERNHSICIYKTIFLNPHTHISPPN
jgi:hypothetical protein